MEAPVTLQFSKMDWTEDDEFTLVGWGATDPKKDIFPDELQEVEVNHLAHKKCEKKWGDNLPMQICAFTDGKDSCGGDSGGPLLTRGKGGKSNKGRNTMTSYPTWFPTSYSTSKGGKSSKSYPTLFPTSYSTSKGGKSSKSYPTSFPTSYSTSKGGKSSKSYPTLFPTSYSTSKG